MTIIPNLVQHLPPITHRHLHPMLSNTIMAKIASTAMISAHHNLPNHPLMLVISTEDVSVNSEEEASVIMRTVGKMQNMQKRWRCLQIMKVTKVVIIKQMLILEHSRGA